MTDLCLMWAARPLAGARLPETPEERLLVTILVLAGIALALLLARPLAAQWRRLPTSPRPPRIVRERTGRRRAWFGWDLDEPAIYGGMSSFYGADLAGEDLTGADLYGVLLSRSDLTEARLTRARLGRARLVHACLSREALITAALPLSVSAPVTDCE
jgi:Pentapeptide repeats (8 copies)